MLWPPEVAKAIWRVIHAEVTEVYNACLTEGVFPAVWKKANLVVLYKGPGKPKELVKSYRPICMLPIVSKVMEGLLVKRLENRMVNVWNRAQFGFRKGRSTQDAWREVKRIVSRSATKYVLGVFIDFKGAFDHLR